MITISSIVIALFFLIVNCEEPTGNSFYHTFNRSTIHEDLKNYQFVTLKEEKIKFILYTSKSPNGYRLFRNNITNLLKSDFNKNYPTKVLIHGYISNYISDAVQVPKDAYLSMGKYNVLVVDWSEYAFPYIFAVKYAKAVGEKLALMVSYLKKTGGLNSSNLHIIGHSLGSHISGYAAKKIKPKPARITGLDPALPLFGKDSPRKRLHYKDAIFVDVIHTSVSVLGITENIGHVDFYPNGGWQQPKCHDLIEKKVKNNLGKTYDKKTQLGVCDHAMSYIYFSETVKNKNQYPAVKCSSLQQALDRQCKGQATAVMGEYVMKRKTRGIYYVDLSPPSDSVSS